MISIALSFIVSSLGRYTSQVHRFPTCIHREITLDCGIILRVPCAFPGARYASNEPALVPSGAFLQGQILRAFCILGIWRPPLCCWQIRKSAYPISFGPPLRCTPDTLFCREGARGILPPQRLSFDKDKILISLVIVLRNPRSRSIRFGSWGFNSRLYVILPSIHRCDTSRLGAIWRWDSYSSYYLRSPASPVKVLL